MEKRARDNIEFHCGTSRRSSNGVLGHKNRRECRDMQWRKTDHLKERKGRSLRSGALNMRDVTTTASFEVLGKEMCSGQSRASRGGCMKETPRSGSAFQLRQ